MSAPRTPIVDSATPDWRDALVDRVAKEYGITSPESIRHLRMVAKLDVGSLHVLKKIVEVYTDEPEI